jgi:hypothetical protein
MYLREKEKVTKPDNREHRTPGRRFGRGPAVSLVGGIVEGEGTFRLTSAYSVLKLNPKPMCNGMRIQAVFFFLFKIHPGSVLKYD